jgi:DNA-binding response OmpR family regulator
MNILVIEDDINLNRLFVKQLRANGHTLESAFSVKTAMDLLTYGAVPDVVVVDLELEDGSSAPILELLKKEAFVKTKVVIVSGNAYSKSSGVDHGHVAHVLLKPVSPRALTLLINAFYS